MLMYRRILSLALLAAAAAVCQAAPVHWGSVADYSFDRFVKEFGREYPHGSAEWIQRQKLFEQRRADILRHNGDRTKSWKRTLNDFSDRFPDEIQSMMGAKPVATKQSLRSERAPDLSARDFLDLPKSVDWREKHVVSAVKDQGHCGSCWAFATTETIESHVALNTGKLPVLSPQQLVSCVANPNHCGGTGGCQGGTADLGYDYVAGHGMAEEWTYGYESFWGANKTCRYANRRTNGGTPAVATVSGFAKVPSNSYESVMAAIANKGPLTISIAADPFLDYAGGVFDGCNSTTTTINHAMQLVGYGTDGASGKDYWLVRNTWSTSWGENGYLRLARHSKSQLCGIDYHPKDGSACDNSPSKVKVCGSCGILYDTSYPLGARHL